MYATSGTTPSARGWLRFPRSARGGGGRPYCRRAPELHRRLRTPPPHARTLHVVRPTNGHRTRPTANWVARGAVPPPLHTLAAPTCPPKTVESETSNPVLSTHPSILSCLCFGAKAHPNPPRTPAAPSHGTSPCLQLAAHIARAHDVVWHFAARARRLNGRRRAARDGGNLLVPLRGRTAWSEGLCVRQPSGHSDQPRSRSPLAQGCPLGPGEVSKERSHH